ncbi:MAG: phosphatase PAP2 family protein [Gammaproteobacteria bacterium]|nr:phosphatase PAP2 family protein [Gammaproteobacteria bacterium]
MFGIPKPLLYASIAISLFFFIFPQVDLWFSRLFYNEENGFHYAQTPWVQFSFHLVPKLATAVIIFLLIAIPFTIVFKKTIFGFSSKAYLYLFLSLSIGPGLIVNSTFKEHWDRARPITVMEFGGDKIFTPAFVISDQCETNCSFTSGHPTILFAFLSLALLLNGQRRRQVIYFSIIGGGIIGLGRIIQGGHFLSDVMISGFIVSMVAYSLYWLMYPDKR